jgi:polyhydroxyalkanoate synthesis regulator protein
MGKQNMALFEQALKMLSPYGAAGAAPEKAAAAAPAPDPEDPRLQRLETQLDAMRRQLDALTNNKS